MLLEVLLPREAYSGTSIIIREGAEERLLRGEIHFMDFSLMP